MQFHPLSIGFVCSSVPNSGGSVLVAAAVIKMSKALNGLAAFACGSSLRTSINILSEID